MCVVGGGGDGVVLLRAACICNLMLGFVFSALSNAIRMRYAFNLISLVYTHVRLQQAIIHTYTLTLIHMRY